MKVTSSTTKSADLSKYATYAWVAPDDTTLITKRDDKMYAGVIMKYANAEIQKKGLKLDNQNPDAVFVFDTRIAEGVESRHVPNNSASPTGYGGYAYGYGYGVSYYGAANPMAGLETTPVITETGTLYYYMYDRKNGNLLWQGASSKKLTSKTDIEAAVKRATTFIFAELPIKKK